MITLPQLMEKTHRVVQAELISAGSFTPHFCALDLCGQITVVALPHSPRVDPKTHLSVTLHLVTAYARHFQPSGLVLALSTPNPKLPLILGFSPDMKVESNASALSSEYEALLPREIFSPFLQALWERPKSEIERIEAKVLWEILQSTVLTRTYAHPSIGSN